MNAILANIHLAVQNRLTAKVPAIKWIDQDLGQLEFYSGKPPVLFPCILLDIVDVQYTDNSLNSQIATATLEVRLAVTSYDHSAHITPLNRTERALEYYNLEHLVNQALHGWCDGNYFAPLSRKSSQTEKREDALRVRPLRYEFAFMDDTAMPVAYSVVPRPDMENQV